MQIGSHQLKNNLILAPMAGVTDLPFRRLCRRLGAGLAVSEMVGHSILRGSEKTMRRANHQGETEPKTIQIVGSDPQLLAEVAQYNADLGADIIDINMGCPAKKICKVLSGSSLLRDEPLVANILDSVVKAVKIPVTLKIRTGWSPENKNGVTIAKIAEDCGIQSLAVHGRTRNCFFKGQAEYETIAAIKKSVKIPVIANGDINTPEQAKAVLAATGADAIMIGRAAQGNPWIFREILHYLTTGEKLAKPTIHEVRTTLLDHLENLYEYYGEYTGVRMARKHVSWYSKGQKHSANFRQSFNTLETSSQQKSSIEEFFHKLADADDNR